ncbi:transcription antitermination factor NusB [Desulfonatronum thioautotrophicum]|uniref:transcription antitermination factor NusB n=1 Tax=Desulfonatronum thioautotrophicum TaxID=617001 RepID=UPI0005EB04C1|nr:transcription antitermination factor NusB [Desulfonatronum thioautotrophicum]
MTASKRPPAGGVPPARIAALAAIRQSLKNEDVQSALDNEILRHGLEARDAALASELCYGYLRHKGRMAFGLERFLRKPGKLPPACRMALEVAAYETLFLDRVPEFATRSWVTNLARKRWGSGLAKVTTAWMTWIFAHRTDLHEPEMYLQDDDPRLFLSRYYSLPVWIVDLWIEGYGLETATRLAEAQSSPPLLGLRINPMHQRSAALARRAESFSSELEMVDALSLGCSRETARRVFPDLAVDLRDGAVSRQSLEAQRVLQHFGAGSWPEPVWDLCAGRGGKTAYLLERGQKLVRAADPHSGRLRGLLLELDRLVLPRISVVRARADAPPPWQEQPRTILLDVPCSGLGVLAPRPDTKWKRTPSDIPSLLALQEAILHQAAASLAPQGQIIYMTCTLHPAENQGVVDRFLDTNKTFAVQQHFATPHQPGVHEFFWGVVLRSRG